MVSVINSDPECNCQKIAGWGVASTDAKRRRGEVWEGYIKLDLVFLKVIDITVSKTLSPPTPRAV